MGDGTNDQAQQPATNQPAATTNQPAAAEQPKADQGKADQGKQGKATTQGKAGQPQKPAAQPRAAAPTPAADPTQAAQAPAAAAPAAAAPAAAPDPAAIEAAKALLRAAGFDVEDPDEAEPEQYVMPSTMAGEKGADILADACDVFGINPDPNCVPRELLNWKHYPADIPNGIDEHVTLVTAGGLKLHWYADGEIREDRDPEMCRRLRDRLRLFVLEGPNKERRDLPFPRDLTLPEEAVTGQVPAAAAAVYRYEGGYLRSGGKLEAAKRADVRAARSASGRPADGFIRRRRR